MPLSRNVYGLSYIALLFGVFFQTEENEARSGFVYAVGWTHGNDPSPVKQ